MDCIGECVAFNHGCLHTFHYSTESLNTAITLRVVQGGKTMLDAKVLQELVKLEGGKAWAIVCDNNFCYPPSCEQLLKGMDNSG